VKSVKWLSLLTIGFGLAALVLAIGWFTFLRMNQRVMPWMMICIFGGSVSGGLDQYLNNQKFLGRVTLGVALFVGVVIVFTLLMPRH